MNGECLSQDVSTDIKEAFQRKEHNFNKNAFKYLKSANTNAVDFRHIPVVNFEKKLLEVDTIEKEKFFCYINWDNIEMDETIVYSNSKPVGIITPCATSACRYELLEGDHFFLSFMKPLVEYIEQINPDIIFRIHNFPGTYWYLKNEGIHVISFENENSSMKNFETHLADDYIQNQVSAVDIFYMKRVKVVSGE